MSDEFRLADSDVGSEDRLSALVRSFSKAADEEVSAGYLVDFFDSLVIPAWIKVMTRGELRIHRVNRAYEVATGLTNEFCQGKLDRDIWKSLGPIAFAANDMTVFTKRVPVEDIESLDMRGEVAQWRVRKWPLLNFRRRVVGVCGTASRVRES